MGRRCGTRLGEVECTLEEGFRWTGLVLNFARGVRVIELGPWASEVTSAPPLRPLLSLLDLTFTLSRGVKPQR